MMTTSTNRRDFLSGSLRAASLMGMGALAVPQAASGEIWLVPNGAGRFDRLLTEVTGVSAAGFVDFSTQLPDASPSLARLAFPLVVSKRLPVLLFCPDIGARASLYDPLVGALAAQGYFVVTLDERSGTNLAKRPDRIAEARFLLDRIETAAAVLGENANMLDAEHMGAIGHGDGAWLAAGLGGWDRTGAANTRSRDGRIQSVMGISPSVSRGQMVRPAQRSPDGVSGMFVGNLSLMPVPARNSGLIGLGLPLTSPSFGGLIGNMEPENARRIKPQTQALAVTTAAAALYFDWTLRGNRASKTELLRLNGRKVAGLDAPLTLRRA